MSEKAHGLTLASQDSTKFGSTGTNTTGCQPVSMSDVEAYLKNLKVSLDKSATGGTAAAHSQAPSPLQASTNVPGSVNNPQNYYQNNLNNPQQERQPVSSLYDPAAQAERLKLDPDTTGLSKAPAEPSLLAGFDGMN